MLQRTSAVLLLLTAAAFPQRQVDRKNIYERVICVTPFDGNGTAADPRRPKYTPWPLSAPDARTRITPAGEKQAGIIAFSYVPSDDGRFAIVEFVARHRAAFQAILNDPSVTTFERGSTSKAVIEAALQKYRKSFNLDQFGTVMP